MERRSPFLAAHDGVFAVGLTRVKTSYAFLFNLGSDAIARESVPISEELRGLCRVWLARDPACNEYEAFLPVRRSVAEQSRPHMAPTRRTLLRSTLTALLLFAFLLGHAQGAVGPNDRFPAVRAKAPLTLHARGNAALWRAGQLPVAAWTDIVTRRAAPARFAERTSILYDDRNLYVRFHVDQRNTPITANARTNDVGFGSDDFVGIGIDPSGDGSRVYYFEVTPAGVRYQQASENARYRPHWRAVARIGNGQWTAVAIIPLAALSLSPKKVQSWRFNFIRSVAASSSRYTWAFNGLMNDGQFGPWPDFTDARFWPSWGPLVFARSQRVARPKPRVDIYTLESLGSARSQFEQADGSFAPEGVRTAGIDVSIPVTSTLNFVGTLAPDFSNVEVDQQTIAPQEFRRNLQEYRPFFSQGASFINNDAGGSNVQTFYSPNIGAFDRGAKLEGTFGLQQVGILSFRGFDRLTGDTFDDMAFGYKHALPDRSFLYWANGVLAHHSIEGNDTTVQIGSGGRNIKNGFVWAVDDSVERGSWVPNGIAHAGNAFLDVHRPNYEVNLGYQAISPTYNPIDGFLNDADVHGFNAFTFLSGTTKQLRHVGLFLNADRYFDSSGAVHQADFGLGLNLTTKFGLSIDGAGPNVGELREYDLFAGRSCSGAIIGTTTLTGFPCYRGAVTQHFDVMAIPVGYLDGTSTPTDGAISWGVFGPNYLHQYSLISSRPLGHVLTIAVEYDGTFERDIIRGTPNSQWLRRLTLGANLTRHSNLTVSLRSINGLGGFATQTGTNLALAYHRSFAHGDLYLNYGTPAAGSTLHRFIVKYVFRVSGEAGT